MALMRTTIDIPDDLLRRTKAAAALQGLKLKDFVAMLLENGLSAQQSAPKVVRETNTAMKYGKDRPVPVRIPATGKPIRALTNEEIEQLAINEDVSRLGRS